MIDAIGFDDLPVSQAAGGLPRRTRGGAAAGLVRLLDALPWWALVGLAAATFLLLHDLAGTDGVAYGAASAGPTTSQLILIVLASAGQYLFPALLLAEAGGVALASHVAAAWPRIEPPVPAPTEEHETRQPLSDLAEPVWSMSLLNRLDSERFAALAMAYYRERGMRCDLLPSGAEGAVILRLFQEGLGNPPVVVQFRGKGAPWVGAKQIAALRAAMDREAIKKGLFMTPGAFSKDAKQAALSNGVTLIDGRLFLMMIGRLAPAARGRLLSFATHAA